MSSTNRSKHRDGHISDYYVTPQDQIKIFLNEFIKDEKLNLTDMQIIDPASGGDNKHKQSYPFVLINDFDLNKEHILTIDVRDDSLADIKDDCLSMDMSIYQPPNIIITNPPFSHAIRFIEKALENVCDNGYVIMLLRLNFLGSVSRFDFFKKYMPKYIYVHHKRISFTDDKRTDSIEYAHFVWHKNNYPKFAQLKVI